MLIHEFARKVYLDSLKSDVDILNKDKLKTVPTQLNNLKTNMGKLDLPNHKLLLLF